MTNDEQKKVDEVKTENLAAGEKFRFEDIPLRKFFEQAQYVEKTLLPKIAVRSGKNSTDYNFFKDVYRSLLYAVMIVDRDRTLIMKLQQQKQLTDYYKGVAEQNERELLKYTTIEDIWMNDAMDKISTGIRQRVEDLLINKG